VAVAANKDVHFLLLKKHFLIFLNKALLHQKSNYVIAKSQDQNHAFALPKSRVGLESKSNRLCATTTALHSHEARKQRKWKKTKRKQVQWQVNGEKHRAIVAVTGKLCCGSCRSQHN